MTNVLKYTKHLCRVHVTDFVANKINFLLLWPFEFKNTCMFIDDVDQNCEMLSIYDFVLICCMCIHFFHRTNNASFVLITYTRDCWHKWLKYFKSPINYKYYKCSCTSWYFHSFYQCVHVIKQLQSWIFQKTYRMIFVIVLIVLLLYFFQK